MITLLKATVFEKYKGDYDLYSLASKDQLLIKNDDWNLIGSIYSNIEYIKMSSEFDRIYKRLKNNDKTNFRSIFKKLKKLF